MVYGQVLVYMSVFLSMFAYAFSRPAYLFLYGSVGI